MNEKEKAKRKEESERGSFFSKNRFAAILIGIALLSAMTVLPVSATHVYFEPTNVNASFCEETTVSVWANTSAATTGGRVMLNYACCCANITDWQRDTTNFALGAADIYCGYASLTFASMTSIGPGLVHIGDLTIHCCNESRDCETDLAFVTAGAGLQCELVGGSPDFANITPVEWLDGTINCTAPAAAQPDLVVEKSVELVDGMFIVSYTVTNIGCGPAAESRTCKYVNGTLMESQPCPVLGSGESHSGAFDPEPCPCGETLNVTVCADNENVVEESDETNNCEVNIVKCPGIPDLVVEKSVELVDGMFIVSYTVTNIGCGPAAESRTCKYVNGTLMESQPCPVLGSGESHSGAFDPEPCPCGETLNVTVCADNENVVEESDETNNCEVNIVKCPGIPDLVVEKSVELVDGMFIVSYTVTNVGCGPAAESKTCKYVNGTLMESQPCPVLGSGESHSGAFDPETCPCGETLNVTVCADNENVVDESDETNNCEVNIVKCPGIPDLVVEKSVELVDGMFIVSYTVTNVGCGPAAESKTCKYVNGTLMESQTCPVLGSGESHSGAFDPEPCPCGETLNVTVCADNENVVDESDETNNCEVNIVKCPGIPDLVVEKSVELVDGMFIVSYTVTNVGCGPAAESRTCKYVNGTLMESQPCPVLGSGESHSGAFDPETCPCGETLNVTVCADNENVVDESDETNNCEVNIVKCPGIPDLVVEKSVELVDGMFIVSYTVTNVGCGPAAESRTCKYVNGTLMESQTCPVLGSGESHSGAFDPETCPCGETLNVTVCADNENVVDESDETNNCEVNIVKCPGIPDLVVEKSVELVDGMFIVSYTVTNVGCGPAAESRTCKYVNGTLMESQPCPVLGSGESHSGAFDPEPCPCGETLNVTVCADNENVVDESDETNNCEVNIVKCPGIPDLVVEKSVELVDGMFIVSYTVTNVGCGPAAESRTCKYVNGTLMESQTCPVLGSGESHSGAFDPEPCPCGETLNVTVCADNENVVEESDETNNCEVNIVKCPGIPDLVVEKSVELVDGMFIVSYTVTNVGCGPAAESKTCKYVNGTLMESQPCPVLGSGESHSGAFDPETCPCGETLNVTVCADNENVVDESDETNNCEVNIVKCPGIPDLVVEKSVELVDGMFIVSYTVTNVGCGPAAESKTCKYVNGTLMESQPCPVLGSGESHSGAFDPETCPCGETLNVTVCADNENVVDESDETNNCEVNIVKCPGIPDLVVEKSVELVDGMFIVSYTVTNVGCGPAAESRTCKYVNGTLMESQPCPVLGSGESHSGAFDPETCPCGETLNVTVCADNENVVDESDETNNCEVNIVKCPGIPDLVVEKSVELVDGMFIVSYTVTNVGCGPAAESRTCKYVNGTLMESQPCPVLGSGESHSGAFDPEPCPCGETLNVTVCADNENVVDESDETNNCEVNIVDCPPCPEPDLNITDKFETLLADGNFTVSYTVKNIGGSDAGASNTTIYIDCTAVLEDPVPALASGNSYTNTVGSFNCPCDQTLNIKVCADNYDVVEESDETNNCMANELECIRSVIPVDIDVKPGTCPNPLNQKSKGVLPVAVLGTAEFDVTTIDPETILVNRSCEGCVGVAPIRWSYEDVATPFIGELCDCHDLNGDGYIDLTLKFDTQELVSNLKLDEAAGETVPLTVTGDLKAENGGTPIEGEDCIRVQ